MKFDIKNRKDALKFLNMLNMTVYWDSINNRPLFRKIPKKSGYSVTRQKVKKWYDSLVDILDLKNIDDIIQLRKELQTCRKFSKS